jgi:hypothetical protein
MTALQLWFLAFLIGIILMFSSVRVKKEQNGALAFFDITVIPTNDNKKIVLAYVIIDVALIGLSITVSLSLQPNWFYMFCLLVTLVVCWKGLYQLQRDAAKANLEELREKRKRKN